MIDDVADNSHHVRASESTDQPLQDVRCRNCGAALRGEYCHQCGQHRGDADELTVRRLLRLAATELTEADSWLLRSVRTLILRPGVLTSEYLAGRQARYYDPVRLYLLASAIFFLFAWNAYLDLGGFMSALEATGVPAEIARDRGLDLNIFLQSFEPRFAEYAAYLRFASVLVSGTGLMVLYWGARRLYVEHLIVSLHYLAFDYIFGSCIAALAMIAAWLTENQTAQWVIYSISFIPYLVYSFFMLRAVYGQSLWLTLVKTFLFAGFQTGLYLGVISVAGGVALAI